MIRPADLETHEAMRDPRVAIALSIACSILMARLEIAELVLSAEQAEAPPPPMSIADDDQGRIIIKRGQA